MHDYVRLDKEKVYEHFKKDATDIEKFIKAVLVYLKNIDIPLASISHFSHPSLQFRAPFYLQTKSRSCGPFRAERCAHLNRLN